MCDTSQGGLTLPPREGDREDEMALRVVTMTELGLGVLLEPQRTSDSVAEVCRRWEISRQSYYRFKRRYEAGGPEA
jgi:Homeodomain-like domain